MFERTASLWRRLTGHVKSESDAGASEGDERRVWLRYPSNVMTQFAPANGTGQPALAGMIRDVSLGGIKLVVHQPIEPGTMLSISLPRQGESSMTVLACVVHCREISTSQWAVGCSFSAELEEGQLLAFGARKPGKSSQEGRNGNRFSCNVKAFCQLPNQAATPPLEAKVLNVSASGMAVQFEQPLPAGTLFSAELHSPRGPQTLTILACVVHVAIQPDGQRISGCNFIRELSETDIEALL
jgi:PilZ domain